MATRGRKPKTYEQAVEMFATEGYQLITAKTDFEGWGSYVDTISPSGFPYLCKPHKFFEGRRCRKEGTASFGEVAIYYILVNSLKKGYVCKDEYAVSIDKRRRFDFAVLGVQGEVELFIEFQGEQHYRSVDYWGGEQGLAERVLSDKVKIDYCDSARIPLLLIPSDASFDLIMFLLKRELGDKLLDRGIMATNIPSVTQNGHSRADIVRYFKNHTAKETAEYFNIHTNTLTRYCKEMGFDKRKFVKKILANYVVE